MTRYLAVADTVHDAAAICDYLGDRAADGDAIRVVPATDSGDRDAEDAQNVFRARLPGVSIESRRTEDGSVTGVLDEARAFDADVILVIGGDDPGSRRVDPGLDRLHAGADRPVVVLPGD